MKSKILLALAIGSVTVISTGFVLEQTKPWAVPDKAAKTANPVKTSPASIAAGKTLWSQHCSSCHGKAGLGDGSKAAQLETTPPDFSKAAFQSQSDGSLFFKTVEGRKDMPSFKKKLPEQEDIWNLVNFMRSLKK
jgi:mono/diheme cytochrome c family protein